MELIEVLSEFVPVDVLALVFMVCFLLVQIRPHIPVSVSEKVPNIIWKVIEVLAGNYKHASNERTDINGNDKWSKR